MLSNDSIVLKNVDLGVNGRLQIEADRNNNNVGSSVTAGNLRAISITVLGSTSQNDTATISGTVQSLGGSTVMRQFQTITLSGDVTSANEVTVTDVSQQLRLGSNVDLLAGNGNLTLLPAQIVFVGASATTNTLDARGAMNLASLSAANNVQVVLLADGNVQLAGSALAGTLNVTAGNHAALSGLIESSQRLNATALTLTSATGIGTATELLTGAGTIAATNRLSGDIRIGNQSSNTNVNILRTLAGGNIVFHQVGGPATFQRVETFVDATPAINENRIELRVIGGNLSITSTGLFTDGLGPVELETQTSGNVQLQSDLNAPNSAVTIKSAQSITGTG